MANTDRLNRFVRRDYYFVKAIRKMSNGEFPHGRCKGFDWDHGYSGPHTQKEARRVAAIWGGQIISMAEGLEALDALRKGAVEEILKEDATVETTSASVDDELALGAAREAEARTSLPPYDELDYFQVIEIMKEADFDYEEVGGGRKKANVIKAWDIFRNSQ